MCFHGHFLKFGFLSLFCLVVVLTHLAKVSNADTQCVDKYHHKYRFCECEREYADILPVRHLKRNERHGVHRYRDPQGNIQYYRCKSCKICQHGLKVESPCSETNNTVCGTECNNPSEIYDPATKACQSKSFIHGLDKVPWNPKYLVVHRNIPVTASHERGKNTEVKQNVQETTETSTETDSMFLHTEELDNDFEQDPHSAHPEKIKVLYIVIIVSFSTLILLAAISLCYLFPRLAKMMKSRDDKETGQQQERQSVDEVITFAETRV
ncbi:uncharacterized protein [Ptychodera flava]|uniref:uncharacterized protein n=1 Tax=Ptychodera flava TaxID=63121 RepID=UPI00396AA118